MIWFRKREICPVGKMRRELFFAYETELKNVIDDYLIIDI